jgi:hypothetical protein
MNCIKLIIYSGFWTLIGCQNSGMDKYTQIDAFINDNFQDYSEIYSDVQDQIQEMKEANVQSAMSQIGHNFKIDSLMIFNRTRTKFYTTVNTSLREYHGANDLIQSLYGVKIDGRWYVFLGKYNLVALRAGYKYNKYEPFTWEELSYVAHEQMFRRYISLDRKGNVVIDYEQLEADVNPEHMCGTNYINEPTIEQGLIKCYENKMSKIIDSTHLAQIYADIEAGKDKEREPVQKPGWVQRKLGVGVPIFESKAWKRHLEERRSD